MKYIYLRIHILSYILLLIKNETSLKIHLCFFPLGVAFIDFRTEKEWDEAMRKNKLFIGKVYPIDQINLKHFCVWTALGVG